MSSFERLSRSRSRSPPPDRPFAALDRRDASVRRPHDRQTGLDIKGLLQAYPCGDTSLKKNAFRAAVRADGGGVPPCHLMRSSLLTRRWRETDSNLRSPVRRIYANTRDCRRSRAPEAQIAGKMAKCRFGTVGWSAPLLTRCGRSAQLAGVCGRPRAGAGLDRNKMGDPRRGFSLAVGLIRRYPLRLRSKSALP